MTEYTFNSLYEILGEVLTCPPGLSLSILSMRFKRLIFFSASIIISLSILSMRFLSGEDMLAMDKFPDFQFSL